jgi:Lsr2
VAKQTTVKLVDDLDGSEAVDTVAFSIDGRQYEMDLSDKNAAKLRDALAPFVASVRQIGGGRRRRTSPKAAPEGKARETTNRERTAAIREWARQHGHQISDRGRIPKSIVEAYQKVN